MSADFWSPIKLSIEIAFVSGIVATISGLIFGKIMANRKFKGKAIISITATSSRLLVNYYFWKG
jgi:molybdate transport system permease protein